MGWGETWTGGGGGGTSAHSTGAGMMWNALCVGPACVAERKGGFVSHPRYASLGVPDAQEACTTGAQDPRGWCLAL